MTRYQRHVRYPRDHHNAARNDFNASTYLVCRQDRSLPPVWQRRFAKQLGVQQLMHIDAGHQVMNTHPQLLAEALLWLTPSRASQPD